MQGWADAGSQIDVEGGNGDLASAVAERLQLFAQFFEGPQASCGQA